MRTLIVLLALACPVWSQAAENPDHIPAVNVWWGWNERAYTIAFGSNATIDLSSAAAVTLGAVAAFDAITGSDSSLGIVGQAGSSGAGGGVIVQGGAGDTGENGGIVTVAGGSGNGAGTGGVATLQGGPSGGLSGTAGKAVVDAGAATGGTAAGVEIGLTNANTVIVGPALQTQANIGTPGVDVTTTTEYGDGYTHTTVLAGIDVSAAVTSGGTEAVTAVLYTFPEGGIVVHAVTAQLDAYAATATSNVSLGAGTAAAAADGGVLTGTEQNLVDAATRTLTTSPGVAYDISDTPATSFHDGTSSAITVNLNCVAQLTHGAADTVHVTGTVTIAWSFAGDY